VELAELGPRTALKLHRLEKCRSLQRVLKAWGELASRRVGVRTKPSSLSPALVVGVLPRFLGSPIGIAEGASISRRP